MGLGLCYWTNISLTLKKKKKEEEEEEEEEEETWRKEKKLKKVKSNIGMKLMCKCM